MHMAKDNGLFNEYITKRELKRHFHIIDKHIARYFPEPVRINISKFGDTFRDAYPLSVVESIMQSNRFRNAYYAARGSTEPDAAERKTIRPDKNDKTVKTHYPALSARADNRRH